jgi:hypothetical protein
MNILKQSLIIAMISIFFSSTSANSQIPGIDLPSTPSVPYYHDKTIALEWQPLEPVDELPMIDLDVFKNKKIGISHFNDLRQDKTEIGRNIEKPRKTLLVTTNDNVAKWLTDRFTETLKDFQIYISPVNENADLLVEADILKFYVTERNYFKADIALKMRIKSKTGSLLWEGMVFGYSKQHGRSFDKDKYTEGLSTACVSAVYSFLKNDSLKLALQQNRQ